MIVKVYYVYIYPIDLVSVLIGASIGGRVGLLPPPLVIIDKKKILGLRGQTEKSCLLRFRQGGCALSYRYRIMSLFVRFQYG